MKAITKGAQLKNNAKTIMAGKYYATIMALIFYNMLTLFLTNFSSSFSNQIVATLKRLLGLSQTTSFMVVLSYFVIFLFTALCSIFKIGICLFFLNIACGQYFGSFDLFNGFYEHFGRSYKLCLVMTGLSTLCFAPVDAALYLYRNGGITVTALELLVVLQLILAAVYIPLSMMLSQVYYITLDYPDLSVPEILKLSCKIMNGKKMEFFKLQLSFLPLFLLTIPTFGLGALWLTPYLNMTNTLFYLDLMKQGNDK